MSLIRNLGILAFGGMLAGGCQVVSPTPPVEKMNTTPLVIDEAMQIRDWEPVTAYYDSGAVVAGPHNFPLEPSPDLPYGFDFLTDNVLFGGQAVVLPITVIIDPPWNDVTYRGVRQDPSYTSAPPLETDVEYIQRHIHQGYR